MVASPSMHQVYFKEYPKSWWDNFKYETSFIFSTSTFHWNGHLKVINAIICSFFTIIHYTCILLWDTLFLYHQKPFLVNVTICSWRGRSLMMGTENCYSPCHSVVAEKILQKNISEHLNSLNTPIDFVKYLTFLYFPVSNYGLHKAMSVTSIGHSFHSTGHQIYIFVNGVVTYKQRTLKPCNFF